MRSNTTLTKSAGLRRQTEFRVFFQRSGNRTPYFADAVIYSQAVLSYNNCIIGNSKPQQSEVPHMNPKLRIMTIRLMKKMADHSGYAAWIGIEGSMTRNRPDQSERSK